MHFMKHIAALDGLRAIAILDVVASHMLSPLVPGSFGVTLFFFISGFIITRLLLSDETNRLLPFYIRRFFRLGPALLVYVAACILALLAVGAEVVWKDVAAALLYYANYNDPHMVSMSTMWSLAVEEHFYLLFPPVFMALRRQPERLQWALVGVLIACFVWRCNMVSLGYTSEQILRHTESRIDSIAFGCLLSVLIHRGKIDFVRAMGTRRMLALAGLLIVATLAIRSEVFRQTARYSLQGVAFFVLFCALFFSDSAPRLRRLFEMRAMVYIGRISYSLYLYHEFGLILGNNLGRGSLSKTLIAFAVTIPATLLSFYVIETPSRRLGARIAQRIAISARDGVTHGDEPSAISARTCDG